MCVTKSFILIVRTKRGNTQVPYWTKVEQEVAQLDQQTSGDDAAHTNETETERMVKTPERHHLAEDDVEFKRKRRDSADSPGKRSDREKRPRISDQPRSLTPSQTNFVIAPHAKPSGLTSGNGERFCVLPGETTDDRRWR